MTGQPVWVSCQQCPAGQPCKQAPPAQCLAVLARLAGRLALSASHAGWDGGPNRLAGPLRLPGQPARLGSQLAWLGSSRSYRSLKENGNCIVSEMSRRNLFRTGRIRTKPGTTELGDNCETTGWTHRKKLSNNGSNLEDN